LNKRIGDKEVDTGLGSDSLVEKKLSFPKNDGSSLQDKKALETRIWHFLCVLPEIVDSGAFYDDPGGVF